MRTIRDIFGPPSHQPFAFYDPDSSSVRTSQATLLSDSTPSSPTLPRWGSMCGGALYELRTPELLTSGLGSSGLLGTPNAHERTHSPRAVDHGIQLANQVSVMFQTPSAADAMGGHLSRGGARSHELLLKGQVKALLPTPAVNDMGAGKTPEQWDSWTDEMRERHGNGNGHGRSLAIEAQRLLPTPTANDHTGGEGQTREQRQQDGATGGPMLRDIRHLLPTIRAQNGETRNSKAWVRPLDQPQNIENVLARLPGASTSLRSDGGSSSTGQHPGQLTIEDA